MKILYCFLSYKRPKVFAECVRTAYEHSYVKPTLSYILDDNSGEEHQQSLINFAKEYSEHLGPINLVLNKDNLGVGNQLETAFSLARQHNPDFFFLIEGDYYFRSEFLIDIFDAFKSNPYSWGVTGCHHADMLIPTKYHGEFCKLMEIYFGRDIETRLDYYKPFISNTERGDMEILPCTNTCGTQGLLWAKMVSELKEVGLLDSFYKSLYDSFHEKGDRKMASDGRISCSVTHYFHEYLKFKNIEPKGKFSYLTPIPSIAFHAANGGINGKLDPRYFPEGDSFPGVNSGTFPKDYNNWTREGHSKIH